MEHENKVEICTVSYNDTGYKLDELERIFDKKAYQRIIKRKSLDWTNLYLFVISALKCLKKSPKNCQQSAQEIMYALEKLEQSWSWFHLYNKLRFIQLVRYHVLKMCDVDLIPPKIPMYSLR